MEIGIFFEYIVVDHIYVVVIEMVHVVVVDLICFGGLFFGPWSVR